VLPGGQSYIPSVRAKAQLYIKYWDSNNIMGGISEFKREQIVGVCLGGSSVTRSEVTVNARGSCLKEGFRY